MAMFGLLHSLARLLPGPWISKRISENCGCGCYGDIYWLITLGAPKTLHRVSDTTTSYLGGLILTKHTLATSGAPSTFRLWLIFAGWAAAIDSPVIWPITWLKRPLHAIATLGIGFGKALLRAGSYSVNFLKKMAGITKSS